MSRLIRIAVAAVAVAIVVFVLSFYAGQRISANRMVQTGDELSWLRNEFGLNEVEMARVRELHQGYLPKCREMCGLIAAKKQEVERLLSDSKEVTGAARQKLIELGELRAQCQARMLEHFVEVSRAMPPQQGERYLAEMRRVTLGTHEKIEQSMSHPAGDPHAHH